MPFAAKAETLAHRSEALAAHFTVLRPEGEGPFPVVFMLHGCGGPRPFIRHMGEVARDAGAAAIIIDSYAHRGIGRIGAYATVCIGARLHGRERAGDLYAAAAWARMQSWADANAMAAIGWSHGGWTIMDALALRSGAEMARATGLTGLDAEPLAGLQRAMLVYPYAGVGSFAGRRPWRLNPHSIAIVAERDYVVGPTLDAMRRQRALSPALQILQFPGATHAFEDQEAFDLRVRYDPHATRREHDLLRAMIAAL